MAETYLETADDSEVIKQTSIVMDIDAIADEYTALKVEFQEIPDWNKTIPDAETLAYWNAEMEQVHANLVHEIKMRAGILLERLTPIRDAGFLPDRYEDKYTQLVNFVNS